MPYAHKIGVLLLLILLEFNVSTFSLYAQDLDPRAYSWVPKNVTALNLGYSYSGGSVLTDPTIQIDDVEAQAHSAILALAHSFSFFGMTSQALVAVPYSWADFSGKVVGENRRISRSGFSDLRMRWSFLFYGAPSRNPGQIIPQKKKTILGASINIVAPTGEFYADKLVNLGTNRWSFRPELAISHQFGQRWLLDFYTGIWFFTDNDEFFPGDAVRSQDPLGTIQGHLSYNINPQFWIAIDATWYGGGNSYVDGINKDNRQSNSRIGVTSVIPINKQSSIKIAASTGAIVRIGQDFQTISVGWQRTWLGKVK
ncbi:transporter [Namhaeicola litoreus]|uniref:Transporter n=1 Tax=Namhaeicola litoreus TaxID=1052145 RepID=A0ABW3Y5C1_9FLAO